ncbi:MAG: hypothetical protein KDC95_14070 [Planctomycetes bacterium]|nr:hypothetical protein [Planctomycetota bacterium]
MRLPLSLVLLSATAIAQIPLPNYSGPFKASATRGYFFTAPTTVVVTGLQVPDEAKVGKQVVALYKLSAPPPAYSQSVAVTPVFYAAATNNDVIPIVPPQIFQKGDVVAVLGAAGDASGTIVNSYGSGNYSSRVSGQPITLLRCLMQTNIATSNGVGQMSSEGNGSIARVRMFVIGQGQQVPYGATAAGGELTVSDPNPPSINYTAQFQVVPAGTNQGALLLIGASRLNINTPYGVLLVSLPFLATGVLPSLPSTGSPVSIALPNDTNLLGAIVNWQAGVINAPNIALTNAMEWKIGN